MCAILMVSREYKISSLKKCVFKIHSAYSHYAQPCRSGTPKFQGPVKTHFIHDHMIINLNLINKAL